MRKFIIIFLCALLALSSAGASAEDESPFSGIQPGDLIVFGRYEQDGDLTNGSEPIAWLALDKRADGVLLISLSDLAYRAYHDEIMSRRTDR